MKKISNFLTEKLKLKSSQYDYHPKDLPELRRIILKEITNNGNDADLNNIDTSAITDMSALFAPFSEFCGDISMWNVSNVEKMGEMFYGCEKFNCDISGWDVSHVTTMREMFFYCKSFNQDLNDWDVSNVKDMYDTFKFTPKLTKPKWYD